MVDRGRLQTVNFDRFHNFKNGIYAEGYHAGMYSDDTEHTIGLARALMDERPFSEGLLLEYWLAEYFGDLETNGFPRHGHGSIESFYTGQKTIEEVRQFQAQKPHPGNAPVMRAAVLGFLPSQLISEYAIINAEATHPHEEAREASQLIAWAAHFLLHGGNHSELLRFCSGLALSKNVQNALKAADRFAVPEEISNHELELLCGLQPFVFNGEEIHGLPCSAIHTALTGAYILKHTTNPMRGLERSVKIGGDVDSLAAISVGILSERYGLSSLPDFILDNLEGSERLRELGLRFDSFLQKFHQ